MPFEEQSMLFMGHKFVTQALRGLRCVIFHIDQKSSLIPQGYTEEMRPQSDMEFVANGYRCVEADLLVHMSNCIRKHSQCVDVVVAVVAVIGCLLSLQAGGISRLPFPSYKGVIEWRKDTRQRACQNGWLSILTGILQQHCKALSIAKDTTQALSLLLTQPSVHPKDYVEFCITEAEVQVLFESIEDYRSDPRRTIAWLSVMRYVYQRNISHRSIVSRDMMNLFMFPPEIIDCRITLIRKALEVIDALMLCPLNVQDLREDRAFVEHLKPYYLYYNFDLPHNETNERKYDLVSGRTLVLTVYKRLA